MTTDFGLNLSIEFLIAIDLEWFKNWFLDSRLVIILFCLDSSKVLKSSFQQLICYFKMVRWLQLLNKDK